MVQNEERIKFQKMNKKSRTIIWIYDIINLFLVDNIFK